MLEIKSLKKNFVSKNKQGKNKNVTKADKMTDLFAI